MKENMKHIKTLIFLIFLSLFVFADFYIHIPIAFASQIEAIEDEDDLAAISFENITEAKFEQVPDSIHEIVRNNILKNDPSLEVSYAQSAHGKTKGEYIVMVKKQDVSVQNQQLASYVISANGDIKQVTHTAHLSKVMAFVPKHFHAASKIISHVDSKQVSQKKDNSFEGIRNRYNQELVEMAKEIEAIGLENITEEQARRFYQKRRELGKELKDESGLFAKLGIYTRNLWKYGDTLGPTYDSFAKKGMSPAEIAVKAVTSGGGDLGLKNNANNPVVAELKKQLNNPQRNKAGDGVSYKAQTKQDHRNHDTKLEQKQKSSDKINIWFAKPPSKDNPLRSNIKLNNKKIELYKRKMQSSDQSNHNSADNLGNAEQLLQ